MLTSMNTMLAAMLVLAPLAAVNAAEPAASVTLVSVTGNVAIITPSGRMDAKPPMELDPGTTIKTGENSSALLVMENASKMRVGANSEFILKEKSAGTTTVSILRGTLESWIKKLKGRRLNVQSPGAVAAVRGTVFVVTTDGTKGTVTLFNGELHLTDSFGRSTIINPGQLASWTTDRGLAGTSSIPKNVTEPKEPETIALLKKAAPTKELKKEKTEETEEETTQNESNTQTSSSQETSTVSPTVP